MIYKKEIQLTTTTQFELLDLTGDVKKALAASKIKNGQILIFTPHTTASVRINHFEPLLKQDIMKFLYRIAPVDLNYAHDFFEIRTEARADERSNGHAHVKAFLLGASETVPIEKGQMLLGQRQSIFFVELDGGRKRTVIIQVIGE